MEMYNKRRWSVGNEKLTQLSNIMFLGIHSIIEKHECEYTNVHASNNLTVARGEGLLVSSNLKDMEI